MSEEPKSRQSVLIVSDIASEAALVKSLLDADFETVLATADADAASETFRKERPAILVLAHKVLDSATRFYLGLYRRGTELKTPVHPHRTIALCDRKDVKQAADLCINGQINDYVQFWPTTYDAPRLLITVRRAMQEWRDQAASAISSAALIAQGDHLAQLEKLLAQYMGTGAAHLATANLALASSETGIQKALAGLSERILKGASVQLRPGIASEEFSRELSEYSAESILPQLRATTTTLAPLSEWAAKMDRAVTPQIKNSRAQLQQAMPAGRLILIVDDDHFQRQLAGRVVESAGYRPVYAGSGAEAFSIIRKAPPDLILMDVLMPDMNGLEAVRLLKGDAAMAKIPVIMVTGESVRNVVLESMKLGVSDFVVKPIERVNLLGKMARLLALAASNAA